MKAVMQVSCSYTVYAVHILNILGVVICPGAGKKLTVKCPGPGIFSVQMPRGCPGGMVRVGNERDISLDVKSCILDIALFPL